MRIMGRGGHRAPHLANVLSRLVASHGLAGRSEQADSPQPKMALPVVREFGK